ncbi:MAG: SDR family oxidoreductase [Cyclobacteriaceae bacterium]|nr:SDR family oxidoreductase [Cyclobacteriaceae bacterium]
MKKKWIVVTGGSRGIGRAIVEKFTSNGFNAVVCGRNFPDLEALKDEIEQKQDVQVLIKSTDLAIKEEVKDFCEFVLKYIESPAVLVNNAGVFVPGAVHDEQEGVLEKMMKTNVYSAYHITRALLPAMKSAKQGHIFNMCSTASIIPYVNGGSYCITKFALLGFSKVLREELKETGIKVTAVLPGATHTDSWKGVDIPEERFMKPEDVAETVYGAYALSERAVIEEILMRPQLGDI